MGDGVGASSGVIEHPVQNYVKGGNTRLLGVIMKELVVSKVRI